MDTPPSALAIAKYLRFSVGGQEYAIEILRSQEIIPLDTLTDVPGAPPAIRGVINLRGSVVPVIDLGLRFGKTKTETTKTTCVVIVEVTHGEDKVVRGILADEVSRVVTIDATDVQKTPEFGTDRETSFLKGMAKNTLTKKFTMILDLDKVFGEDLTRPLPADARPTPGGADARFP